MTNHNSMHVVGSLLTMLMMAAGSVNGTASDVLTLISPNEEANGQFGNSVAAAGDVNKDGFADLIVGAWQEDPGTSPTDAGRAYVLSGEDGGLLFELVSPNEEAAGFFGRSVDGAGDVNRDGLADVIVGSNEDPGNSPMGAGRAYVFSGQDGSLLFELVSPNEEGGGVFGWVVAGAGDVNQDGLADLIVGASGEDPGTSPSQAGRAYVFSGRDGSLLFELASPNQEPFAHFGSSVAGAGDVNRDGFADVIVGTPVGPYDGAHVFSGEDGTPLFYFPNSPTCPSPNLGHVAGAGDVNQDGAPDVIVGGSGYACVFSGQDGSQLFKLASPSEGSFGDSVAGAGDVNQDGHADVIVGAFMAEGGTSPEGAGRSYIFSGQDGGLLVELVSPNEEAGGGFGKSVAGAGDVNQDGLPDVIVGAWKEDPGTSPAAGRAYVFLSPGAFRINSGGPNYTDTDGSLFVADRAYTPGGFGYVGGREFRFDSPIGGTDDDPLYQDVRVAREGDADGIFAYRFDVDSPARYNVTLYLMAPALEGPGNIVMDVAAEGDVVLDDLDVTAEAGGTYQALVKTFAVDVNDGSLDLRFRAVNKAAVVSAIAVALETEARGAPRKVSVR